MRDSGRTPSDIKISKVLGGIPYTNVLALSSKFYIDSYDYKLSTTLETLQDLPHKQLTTASKVKFASTSNDDSILGIGARLLLVGGLVNYQFFEEIIQLNGQTPIESVNFFDKIFDITIIEFGSNIDTDTGDSKSIGDIYCGTGIFTLGIPDNPIVGIAHTDNDPTSRVGIFTIPDGKYGFVREITASVNPELSRNSGVSILLALNFFGFDKKLWAKAYEFTFNQLYSVIPETIFPIPPKTDIQIRVKKLTQDDKIGNIFLTLELKDIRS